MLRRISTKLVLAVLLAVVLPFVAFAFYLNEELPDRLRQQVVQPFLLGLVKNLAGQLDYFVVERRTDLLQWADAQLTARALENDLEDRGSQRVTQERAARGEAPLPDEDPPWSAATMARLASADSPAQGFPLRRPYRAQLMQELNDFVDRKPEYELVVLVSADGRLVTCSSKRTTGQGSEPLSERFLEYLFAYDYSREDWFRIAMQGEYVRVDHHVSPLHLDLGHDSDTTLDPAWDYALGFAAPVRAENAVRGVLYGLVNWKFIQDLLSTQVITDAFRGLVAEDRAPSAYAWLWAEDADLILAHPNRALYYERVSDDLDLPQLTRAVLDDVRDDDGWGLYPEYRFQGEEKSAAFHVCSPRLADGFGWVVGVGINNEDIFSTAKETRTLLLGGTAVVLVLSVCLTLYIARRTTGPIRELQRHVRRVAEGDLDARIEIQTRDELGALAEDVNRMTGELKTQRERIVKAEKDAAWKEMARQIAHDIKNPLTPMKLSLDLLERARRERAAGSDEILERTMGLMRRQVENLRQIANDFYEFTGGKRAHPSGVEVSALLEEVLHLHDAWAVERGVVVHQDGPHAVVWADLGKLRRALVNLVSNALQAMPEGGDLFASTAVANGSVSISIRDTGGGLTPEARAHLFEPYFTTKSEGTGLGLAITKRALEEMDGEIELVSGPEGVGTIARVRLPLHGAGETGGA